MAWCRNFLAHMPFAIHLKHDTAHRTWMVLSVVTLQPDSLVQDIDAYKAMFARAHQMNQDQLAARVVEISREQIGARKPEFIRIVHEVASNAAQNQPTVAAA